MSDFIEDNRYNMSGFFSYIHRHEPRLLALGARGRLWTSWQKWHAIKSTALNLILHDVTMEFRIRTQTKTARLMSRKSSSNRGIFYQKYPNDYEIFIRMNTGTFMFEVRTFAVIIFIRIWPYCQPTSVRCQQACTTGGRVTCEVGRFAWKARACM